MEPPAVTSSSSSSSGHHGGGGGVGGSKDKPVDFLQIEPTQLSFTAPTTNRQQQFEELPENFLETISPQQQQAQSSNASHQQHSSNSMQHLGSGGGGGGGLGQALSGLGVSPHLAPLTAMGGGGGGGGGGNGVMDDRCGYSTLISIPTPTHHYINSLKMESLDHHLDSSQMHVGGKPFGESSAGLLSPLQLDRGINQLLHHQQQQQSIGSLLGSIGGGGHHRSSNGGGPGGTSRTSELLSGIHRRPVSYIKEEIRGGGAGDLVGGNVGGGFHHHQSLDYSSGFSSMQPTQQELDRIANAETPPALSNVDIESSLQQPQSQSHQLQTQHFIVRHMQQQQPQQLMEQPHRLPQPAAPSRRARNKAPKAPKQVGVRGDDGMGQSQQQQQQPQHFQMDSDSKGDGGGGGARFGVGPMGPGAGVPRATYSTTDTTDPLNAEIDEEIYIDTKDLCKRVAYELKQHSIPQAIFAERILCRSQGTLSDLLRNPKPWNRLKSGRETFRRMFNWLQQPLHIRLSILDMYKSPIGSTGGGGAVPPPVTAQNSRHHSRTRHASGGGGSGSGGRGGGGGGSGGGDDNNQVHPKRPRLVFTDIQKRTLQAIFKETQRPSREMQQTIAEHLRLDMSTVSNFFMNARRRSRNGSNTADDEEQPAPYQQIRPITPPPVAQQRASASASRSANHGPRSRPAKAHPSASTPSSQSQSQQQLHQMAHHIEETVDEVVSRSLGECSNAGGSGSGGRKRRASPKIEENPTMGMDIGAEVMEPEMEPGLSPLSGEEPWNPAPAGDDDEDGDGESNYGTGPHFGQQEESLPITPMNSVPTTRSIPLTSNKTITVKVEHESSSSSTAPTTATAQQQPIPPPPLQESSTPSDQLEGAPDTPAKEEEEAVPLAEPKRSSPPVDGGEADANAPTAPGSPVSPIREESSPNNDHPTTPKSSPPPPTEENIHPHPQPSTQSPPPQSHSPHLNAHQSEAEP